MRYWVLILCVVLCAVDAWAHRVNIFAFVEGADVVVECGYSKSKRVRNGAVEIFDYKTGQLVLHGQTDEQGLFRFPLPEQVRATGADLRIVLKAGEGHQAEWVMPAAEFVTGDYLQPEAEAQITSALMSPVASGQFAVPGTAAGLTRGELEAVVNAALDAKLAPLKRVLLEDNGPGVREIIGGIGWIFGLVGVAAYFMSRRRV